MEVTKKLTVGTIITLLLAMSGTYFVAQEDNAYYCEDRDMVMICEKLSAGLGTRCYYKDTYKNCKEGWTKVEIGQEVDQELENPIQQTGKKYLCNQIECLEIGT